MTDLYLLLIGLTVLCLYLVFGNSYKAPNISQGKTRYSGNPKTYINKKVYTTRSGYEYIYNKQGQPVYVHRIQAMKMLGRNLKDDEVVHHKDEDPSNNEFSNLEVMTRKQHHRHHRHQPKNVFKRHINRSLKKHFKRSFGIKWF